MKIDLTAQRDKELDYYASDFFLFFLMSLSRCNSMMVKFWSKREVKGQSSPTWLGPDINNHGADAIAWGWLWHISSPALCPFLLLSSCFLFSISLASFLNSHSLSFFQPYIFLLHIHPLFTKINVLLWRRNAPGQGYKIFRVLPILPPKKKKKQPTRKGA